MEVRDLKTNDDVWKKRKDAHLTHHRIADFILHKDDREHPPRLRALVKKYRSMMAEADEIAAAQASNGRLSDGKDES